MNSSPYASFRFVQRTQLQPKVHKSRRPGRGLRHGQRRRLLACEKQVSLSLSAAKFSLGICFPTREIKCVTPCVTSVCFLGFQLGNSLGRRRLRSNCQKQEEPLRDCQLWSLPYSVKKDPPPESSACNLGYTFRLFIYDQRLDVCCFPFLQ